MRMAATVFAAGLTLAAAYMLYVESIETRRLEAQVQAAERLRERLEAEIGALKVDRAFLSRPTRIEPAAREIGMRPAGEPDYAALADVVPHVAGGERRR